MALTYDDITATTIKHFRPALVDNIFNDIPLFKRMRAQDAVSVRGGDSIMQSLLYATTTSGGSYSGYDVLLTTPNEQISAAEFSWKQYYVNITIDKLSVLKNSGPEQIFNLLQKRVQAAQLTMADTLATDLFSDGTTNSNKCITGLRAAVDDSMFCAVAKSGYMLENPCILGYSPYGSKNPSGAGNQQERPGPQVRESSETNTPDSRRGEDRVRSLWRHREDGRNGHPACVSKR